MNSFFHAPSEAEPFARPWRETVHHEGAKELNNSDKGYVLLHACDMCDMTLLTSLRH